MIDIHSHILPGLDDGAASMEEAVAMARCAVAGGISQMVGTPHVKEGKYPNSREMIVDAMANLRKVLLKKEIRLFILPGAEYSLEPDLPQRFSRGELLTINNKGRYLLVELPASFVPDYTATVLYDLQLQGVTPIIAHPERNAVIARDHTRLYELVARGALAQITAGSLTGLFGAEVAAAARAFLERGCVHFIASDAHSSNGRLPHLASAAREAERILGQEQGRNLVVGNPQLAVRGEYIEAGEISKKSPSKRGLFCFFKKTITKS
jgi:protein-tyrosine phosphatase